VPVSPGEIAWALLDADREPLGGGRFVLLTAEAAEAERGRLRSAAGEMVDKEVQDMTAAVLGEAERTYLW
jgi:hypothetical protein